MLKRIICIANILVCNVAIGIGIVRVHSLMVISPLALHYNVMQTATTTTDCTILSQQQLQQSSLSVRNHQYLLEKSTLNHDIELHNELLHSSMLLSLGDNNNNNPATTSTSPLQPQTDGFEKDTVARIVDANTIKLQKNGLVTLAGIKTPSNTGGNFIYPECFDKSPSYKIKQLLPSNSPVMVKIVTPSPNVNSNQVIIIIADDRQSYGNDNNNSNNNIIVNRELVKSGFARVAGKTIPLPLDKDDLITLQKQAKESRIGIYRQCEEESIGASSSSSSLFSVAPEAQFEPLERTVQTQWGEDGGKQIIVDQNIENNKKGSVPKNPGDTKGCSDFATYEDALRYFETYYPYYGDVAKLDRDGDGVPCPALPHTKVGEKYRMKAPSKVIGIK